MSPFLPFSTPFSTSVIVEAAARALALEARLFETCAKYDVRGTEPRE